MSRHRVQLRRKLTPDLSVTHYELPHKTLNRNLSQVLSKPSFKNFFSTMDTSKVHIAVIGAGK